MNSAPAIRANLLHRIHRIVVSTIIKTPSLKLTLRDQQQRAVNCSKLGRQATPSLAMIGRMPDLAIERLPWRSPAAEVREPVQSPFLVCPRGLLSRFGRFT